jgi:hypothetical protein
MLCLFGRKTFFVKTNGALNHSIKFDKKAYKRLFENEVDEGFFFFFFFFFNKIMFYFDFYVNR